MRIEEINERSNVRGAYLVRNLTLRTGRTGKAYLAVQLGDKTGLIEARIWDDAERIAANVKVGDIVSIVGRASSYRDQLQLSVDSVAPVPPEAVVLEDFLPTSDFALDDLYTGLRALVAAVEDGFIRTLLSSVIEETDFARQLRVAPAAKMMHHAYLGGLVEHSLSMALVMRRLYDHYELLFPGLLSRDLMVAGAVLHDIGKVMEIAPDAGFGYTDDGNLIGHIVMGVELVTAHAARIPSFPPELAAKLKHLIVAHHGKMEFGAPRTPAMPEAFLLHYVDMIDARLNSAWAVCNAAGDKTWSEYNRVLEGSVLNPFAGKAPEQRAPRDPAWMTQPATATVPAGPAPAAAAAPARGSKRPAAGNAADAEDGPENLSLF